MYRNQGYGMISITGDAANIEYPSDSNNIDNMNKTIPGNKTSDSSLLDYFNGISASNDIQDDSVRSYRQRNTTATTNNITNDNTNSSEKYQF